MFAPLLPPRIRPTNDQLVAAANVRRAAAVFHTKPGQIGDIMSYTADKDKKIRKSWITWPKNVCVIWIGTQVEKLYDMYGEPNFFF